MEKVKAVKYLHNPLNWFRKHEVMITGRVWIDPTYGNGGGEYIENYKRTEHYWSKEKAVSRVKYLQQRYNVGEEVVEEEECK